MSAGRRASRGRLGRVVGWLAIGLATLLVVTVVVAWLTLRSVGGRRALFERVASAVEEGTGWRVEVEDYALRPARSTLAVEGLEAGAPGGPPVVEADRLEVVVGLWSLVRGPVVVRSVEVEGWRMDLGRPLPPARPAPEEPAPERTPLPVVRRLELTGGEVKGGPLPEALAARLAAWEVGGIELRGSLEDEALALALERAAVRLRRGDGEVIELAAKAALAGPVGGPWQLDGFEISGAALEIKAQGTVAPPPPVADAGRLSFSLNADVGGLFPDLAGSLSAAGEADLAAGDVRLRLAAREVALDLMLAAAAVGREPGGAAPAFLPAGSRLALTADGRVRGWGSGLDLEAELSWTRADGSLARATVGARRATENESLVASLAADLLPGVSGRRRLSGRLVLPAAGAPGSAAGTALADGAEAGPLGLAPLEAGRLEGGRVEVRLPELETVRRQVEQLWPGLLTAAPAAVLELLEAPGGALSLDAALEGAVLDPELTATASWRLPAAGGLAELRAAGRPRKLTGEATATLRELDLAALEAISGIGLTGLVDARLEARGSPADLRARLELASAAIGVVTPLRPAPEEHGAMPAPQEAGERDPGTVGNRTLGALARGDTDQEHAVEPEAPGASGPGRAVPLVQDLEVVAEMESGRLRIERLDGRAAGGSFSVRGDLDAVLPLRRAELQVELAGPGARAAGPVPAAASLQAARLELRLARGTLELDLPHLALVGSPPGRMSARLPFGSLSALPGAGERLAALPVAAPASGPLTAEWELPPADRAELLASLGLPPELQLHGGLAGEVSYDPADPEAAAGRLELQALELIAGERRVTAEGPLRFGLVPGGLRLEPAALRIVAPEGEARLDLQATLEPGERRGELVLVAALPDGDVRALELRLSLAEGVLRAAVPRVELEGSLAGLAAGASVTATLPLATLAGLPGLEQLGALPMGLADGAAGGPLELAWELPETEWQPLLALLPGSGPLERLRLGGGGELRLDPQRPALGSGEVRLTALSAVVDGRPIEIVGPLLLRLAAGRVTLEPLALTVEGQRLRLAGRAELDPGWEPGASLAGLVRHLNLDADGVVPAELLNPFLAGGVGSGPLKVAMAVHGPPAELEGELRLDGSEAVLRYRAPYFVEIREPVLEALFAGGELRLEKGRLQLNEGEVELEGRLAGGAGPDLKARLDGLRFRLDYGLLASIGGELRLRLPAAEPGGAPAGETTGPGGLLSGRLVVERGSLTRPVRLEREALALLLAPVDLTGTEESPLEAIDLDLVVATDDGVRIRNNAADLWIRWEPLRVRGTLAVPLVEGRFEVEPGGRVHALGQTVRIDRGALELRGEEGASPVLELETTSSLEDPSIARLAGDDPLLGGGEAAATGVPGAVGAGLANYLAEQFSGRLSESLGIAGLTLRPVLVFGETDPSARLTLSQELSAGVALAASLDLRNAERQTYLLDVTEIGRLPRLRGQLFTSDQGSEGVTLQQRLELGGGAPARREKGPRLRRLLVEPPPGVSRRGLRRAIGVERGDPLPEGGLFAIEVEAMAYLQRRGYPDARVEAALEPVPGRRGKGRGSSLELAVDPGPRVRFRFEGPLPKGLQRSVSELYRSDFFEAESLEEMRRQAERALRSRGFVDPEVEVEVTTGEGQPAPRTVLVRSSGGLRLKDPKLELTGVPADEAARLAARFATPVQRLELAAALPEADARLLAALAAAGYPRAAIADRELSDEGQVTISIDAGPRQKLARVEVVGLDEAAEAGRLAAVGGLESGGPATAAGVAAAARAVEGDLRDRGYDDVRVAARLEPLDEAGLELALVLEVEPGPRYRVAKSRVEGLRFTRPRWAARLAGLEEGSVLSPGELADARRRLYGTGLFRALTPTAEKDPAGEAAVVFRAEERSRFLLAYGLRWDSDEGGTAVVDLLDRNLLGRAVTLGLRALWSSDDRNLRLSAKLPYLVFRRGELETLTSLREEITEVDELETWVTSLQLSYPLAERLTGRLYGRYREATLREKVSPDPLFPPETRTFRNPFLGVQMLYDSRQGEGAGVRGLFASADLSGTGEFLGSDFEWLRFFGQFNLYRPAGRWGWRRLSWAQSVRVGLADSFGQVLDRPDRFFAGGDYSVRGYRTESLGPAEFFGTASRPRGGRALLVVNEELRFELLDRLSGLVFVDAGNVWTKTSDFGDDLFSAAGLGLRAATPVGLLRLDVAFPLDRRPEDSAFKLHFGFGNTF